MDKKEKKKRKSKILSKETNKIASNASDEILNSEQEHIEEPLEHVAESEKEATTNEFNAIEETLDGLSDNENIDSENDKEDDKKADSIQLEQEETQEESPDSSVEAETSTEREEDRTTNALDSLEETKSVEQVATDSPMINSADQSTTEHEDENEKPETLNDEDEKDAGNDAQMSTPDALLSTPESADSGTQKSQSSIPIDDLKQWYDSQLESGASLIEIADSKISILERYIGMENLTTINDMVLEEKINRAKYITELLARAISIPASTDLDDFVAETDEEKRELKAMQSMLKRADKILEEAQTLWDNIPRTDPQAADKYYFSGEDADEPISNAHQAEELGEQDISDEDLAEDATARAYEVGVGSELDDYDREILSPVFENHLRMSINPLKYNYSKLKNKIMSYSGITQKFSDFFEVFRANRKVIVRLSIYNDKLYFYSALPIDSLDKSQYPHKKAKGTHAKSTPLVFTIVDEASLERVLEVFTLIVAKNDLQEKTHYTPIAYAERYPLNPNAVVSGFEHNPPFDGEFSDDFNYAPITGEIVDGIIKALTRPKERKEPPTGKEQLEDVRQIAKTIKASVALTEPIVYFYDAAIDASNVVQYINIQQVLNDKFLGKIVPQSYFSIAEGSAHIASFNFLALEHAVELANASPNYRFALTMSVRLLHRLNTLERLIKSAITNNGNLVLAFDCALLESSGDVGINAINRLRNESGVMIMLDNAENAGMRALTEYSYEYLRFDARYYSQEHPKKQAHLRMLVEYCKTQNIRSTSINAMNTKEAQILVAGGVEIIQGFAVSEPKRNITVVARAIKKIPPMG